MVALTEPRHGLAGLHPGNFALVMASAILAQDLRVQGLPRLAITLAAFAAIAYVLLLVLSLLHTKLAIVP